MKIFYHGYDRYGAALVASYIHFNKLPKKNIPTIKELVNLFNSGQVKPNISGVPYFIGNDEYNNEVYIIGFGKNQELALQTITNLKINSTDWKFYSTFNEENILIRLGSILLRCKLVDLGIKLIAYGTRISYLRLVEIVNKIKGLAGLDKRRIIIITDGDRIAQKIVEKVASNVGGRAISLSAGNPTQASAEQIKEAIQKTPYDPVLVMVDDCGSSKKGRGEKVIELLANDSNIEILGAIAVASNTARVEGVAVDASVTREGRIIQEPVDKDGYPEPVGHRKVEGDTVDILNHLKIPVIIGIGDLGKMDDADLLEDGARITTMAVEEVLKRSNYRQ